eukprot:3395727-Heterocapsa_arctica.AAC.1
MPSRGCVTQERAPTNPQGAAPHSPRMRPRAKPPCMCKRQVVPRDDRRSKGSQGTRRQNRQAGSAKADSAFNSHMPEGTVRVQPPSQPAQRSPPAGVRNPRAGAQQLRAQPA